ncbi:ornithine cyclodeaminase family protein [Polymorphospora sp. NPDC051019]|uniref:ornithine cyclodeaminase family protein n=1 Tax=Polymorphospora sp. NPDC051019 TaxID=3155725 RepID=UPI00343815FE
MTASLPYLTAERVAELLSPRAAVEAIEAALRDGFDPATDPVRSQVEVRHGHFLLMPSDIGASTGIKIATVSPGNAGRALPRIQGVYVLFDAQTLAPTALIDAGALTALRTPAVSVAAVRPALLRDTAPLRIVAYGGGPQAVGHAATLRSVVDGHREIAGLTYVVRRPAAYAELAGADVRVVGAGTGEAERAVRAADVVVCATTARTPLFTADLVRADAVVIAVGSHEPDARELDAALLGRAQVVVEDVATALRECGDVVMAVKQGTVDVGDLVPVRSVVTGATALAVDRPVVFKSSGMSWQDLVIADAVVARATGDEESALAY